jgi:hypothetical protein
VERHEVEFNRQLAPGLQINGPVNMRHPIQDEQRAPLVDVLKLIG